ncbi:hypothetical protein GX51_00775 [Blastomyces parvus]|uniref:Uncharacterized protein n=1 Tax=Blastomyces parvus TaxID=2060905 RepID=A0A2B7XL07_9EURO|nr:hypothetical protein GX51_00775 [Blastomyces parvus]
MAVHGKKRADKKSHWRIRESGTVLSSPPSMRCKRDGMSAMEEQFHQEQCPAYQRPGQPSSRRKSPARLASPLLDILARSRHSRQIQLAARSTAFLHTLFVDEMASRGALTVDG